jgi:hypothetical protein
MKVQHKDTKEVGTVLEQDENGYRVITDMTDGRAVSEWWSKKCVEAMHEFNLQASDLLRWEGIGLIIEDEKTPFEDKASEIGTLVETKNKQYGNSYEKSGDFLKLLYPDGVKPEQYKDLLVQVRIFDKQMRIANGDQGEESAYEDIAGYSIAMAAKGEG